MGEPGDHLRGRAETARLIRRRIATVFPKLGPVALEQVWSGVTGQTVHGMPQIGQLRRGLWVSSGFGGQGLNTTAIAGQLIANGIMEGDDRWRRFSVRTGVGRWQDRADRRPGDRHRHSGRCHRRRGAGALPRRRRGEGADPGGAAGGGQSRRPGGTTAADAAPATPAAAGSDSRIRPSMRCTIGRPQWTTRRAGSARRLATM